TRRRILVLVLAFTTGSYAVRARTLPRSRRSALLEEEVLALYVYFDDGPRSVAAREDLLGERVLDLLQDGAFQRARAERGLVPELDELALRGVGELELQLAIAHQLLEATELNVDDAAQVVLRQRSEDDDVVDAIQELGAEIILQLLA